MLIDGDFFESLSDLSFGDPYKGIISPNYNYIIDNTLDIDIPILYIDTGRLSSLLNVVSTINKKFIIISHNSDITYNENIINFIPNNVIRVWCQNYNGIENDRIKPLPIGLERKIWFPEQRKQDVIKDNINNNKSDRARKVYMNFDPNTNHLRREWFNYLKNKSFVEKEMIGNGKDYQNYISKLISYEFVVSPPGNGIDCHRNWECLYLGAIPIIQKSNFSNQMFSDMPVLLVDSYTDINEDLLNNYRKSGNLDKIYQDYWFKKIKIDVR